MKFPELEILDENTINQIDELKKEFQKEISNDYVKQSDWFLLRFLIARKMNQKKTTQMLNEYFLFQKSYQEQFKTKAFMDIKKLKEEFYLVIKTSKNNYPLLVYQLGKRDLVQYFKNIQDLQPLLNSIVYVFEILNNVIFPLYSQHFNQRIDRIDIIMDMQNVKMIKLFKGKFKTFLKQFINIFQEIYPETVGKIVAINLPSLFSMVWSVVKYWLDERTRSKMFLTSNSKDGKNEVQKFILDEELPPEYGGNSNNFHQDTLIGKEQMFDIYQKLQKPQFDKTIFQQYFLSNREIKQINQFNKCIYLPFKNQLLNLCEHKLEQVLYVEQLQVDLQVIQKVPTLFYNQLYNFIYTDLIPPKTGVEKREPEE